jgi:hypothetical protein
MGWATFWENISPKHTFGHPDGERTVRIFKQMRLGIYFNFKFQKTRPGRQF